VAGAGKVRNTYEILVGKLKGRQRCIWEDTIKIYLKEIWWEFPEWIYLLQDMNQWWAVVNTGMNLDSI
jgi:hypothetical protein